MAAPRSSSEAGYPDPAYAWTVVLVLIGTAIVSYTDRQVLSLLVDPIRRELGVDDSQIALLMGSAFALIYGMASLPLGFLADKVSRRTLILAGLLIWSSATVAGGLCHNFTGLFVSRIFVGLGEAALSPAAISLISDCFPPRRRGLAVGCFLSGVAVGSGLAVIIGGAALKIVATGWLSGTPLQTLSPWRLVLLLLGAAGLMWSLAILPIREPQRRESALRRGRAAAASLDWTRLAPIYLVVALASLVDNAVGAWAPSLLIREFSRNAGDVGLELGVLLTFGFGFGVLLGGALADRAGTLHRQLLICLSLPGVIMLVALLPLTHGYLATLWSIPLYFLLSGIVTATGFAAILVIVPPERRGIAISISFFLNVALGGGLGPTVVTLAKDHLFDASAGLAPAITVTAIGGYLLALLLTAVARKMCVATRITEPACRDR